MFYGWESDLDGQLLTNNKGMDLVFTRAQVGYKKNK